MVIYKVSVVGWEASKQITCKMTERRSYTAAFKRAGTVDRNTKTYPSPPRAKIRFVLHATANRKRPRIGINFDAVAGVFPSQSVRLPDRIELPPRRRVVRPGELVVVR